MEIRSVVLAFITFCCITSVMAQKTIFTIMPGEKVESFVPDSVSYLYSSFKNGTVYFKDSRRVDAPLNYNSLFEEIMFIAPGGDTMALDNGALIKYVVITTDTFYFADFFVKNEGHFGDIRLASKGIFVIYDSNPMGAMGTKATGSVTTVRTLLTRGESKTLTRQDVIKIRKETQFYIGDRFNNFKAANRKNLMDFFPEKSKKIREYLKNNSVNFNKRDDLSKIIVFLQAG